jgi:hypothetical protein
VIPSTARTNRLALFSFSAAFFTLSSFCVGFSPIPLTAWVCYPLAVVLAILGLVTGLTALRQVRASGEKGRALALVGVWTSILAILAVLCFTTLSVFVLAYGLDYISQLWSQIKP